MHLLVIKAVDEKGKDVEVSGLGVINVSHDNDRNIAIDIEDLWFLKQVNATGSTNQFPQAVEKWLNDNFPKWHTDPLNRPNLLWWHKHPASTFWSGRDNQTIDNLCKMSGMVLSIVTNRKREAELRLDYNMPLSELPIKINISRHTGLHIQDPDFIGADLREAVDKEWEEKVELREFGEWEENDDKVIKLTGLSDRLGDAARRVMAEKQKDTSDNGSHTPYHYSPLVTMPAIVKESNKDSNDMVRWLEDWEDEEMVFGLGEMCVRCGDAPLNAKHSRVTGLCIECRRTLMNELSNTDDDDIDATMGVGGWLKD